MINKIHKTDAEWRKVLTPEVYGITRGSGTEPAFQNAYWDNEREGLYRCSNCWLALFDSRHKFDSGTGWPSFWQPYKKDRVEIQSDNSHNMIRNEVRCARCGSHLGHIFGDGPQPTSQRYCMNSAALIFESR